MKTPAIGLSALAAVLVLGSGCVSTEVVDLNNDRGPAVMGLDYRDFENAAQDAFGAQLARFLDHGAQGHEVCPRPRCLGDQPGEHFIDAVRRIGLDPFKEAGKAARHPAAEEEEAAA